VATAQVPERLDAPAAVGEGFIAPALGCRRQDVGVLVVIPAMDPSGEHDQCLVELEVVLPVLGAAGDLIEGVAHVDVLIGLTSVVDR